MNKPLPINLIDFNIGVGKGKPLTINGEKRSCPFCNVDTLTDIIDTKEDMIFLKNKYIVLEPSDQFVLIEGADCNSDMNLYTPEKMTSLISFGISHWLKLWETGKYKAVLFFKNYGPLSGGTIHHPHMQIVGLPVIDPDLMFSTDEFEGIPVATESGVEINVATRPRIGFSEINILVKKQFTASDISSPQAYETLSALAHYIQSSVTFLKDFFKRENFSYNIFFYLLDGCIRVKLLPRFATSPLYIGYSIHLKPTNLADTAEKLRTYI